MRKRSRKGRRSGGRRVERSQSRSSLIPTLQACSSEGHLSSHCHSYHGGTRLSSVLLPDIQDVTFCYASVNFCRTFPSAELFVTSLASSEPSSPAVCSGPWHENPSFILWQSYSPQDPVGQQLFFRIWNSFPHWAW